MHTAEPVAGVVPGAGSAEDRVLDALIIVGRVVRQRFAEDSLDPGTLGLLKELAARDAMRVTELATCSGLDASTVSRHVATLHRVGLVDRAPDTADRRAQLVMLSEHGRQELTAGLARRRSMLSRSLADWNTTDTETFDHLLARFVGDLQHIAVELEHA